MNNILKQRNFFVTKEFEMTKNSLRIKASQPFSYADNEIKFENITSVASRLKAPNTIFSIITAIALLGIIITLISHFTDPKGSSIADIIFYMIALIVSVFLVRFTYINKVNIVIFGGQSLSFYGNSPNKQAVDNYIELLYAEQKKYLLNRYAQKDFLSEDQLSENLIWLWERNIIDDVELQGLRDELLKGSSEKVVGFKFNSNNN